MGADAYQRLLRKTPRGELGIYRHGPPEEGGTHDQHRVAQPRRG